MQTTENSAPISSAAALAKRSLELVQDAMALNPKLPAANLLPEILDQAEPEFLAELDRSLRAGHFLALIRTERQEERRKNLEAGWQSPLVCAAAMTLPSRVPIGGGKKIARGKLEFAHTVLYLKFLDKEGRDKRKNDARRAAIKTIQKLWPRAKKRPRQMTLAEVDVVKAAPPK